ncbi:MAG: hypothetical protein F4089_05060 [Gammaproteobacteria bacterium]|nr:hypothetical protein [Gammaproteobacteria bacterium]MYJ74493.1 hypothetical protein [Gammaproteobacteria bacterium]
MTRLGSTGVGGRRDRQEGIVLFLGLAVLLAIAAGGLSGAYTTTLELRMSRNSHDMTVAFQAAEAALVEAEAWLEVNGDPTSGSRADLGPSPLYGDVAGWRSGSSWTTYGRTVQTSLPGVTESPRVLVEWLTTFGDDAAVPPVPVVDVFRITAVGFGFGRNTTTWLQSTFARARDPADGDLTGRRSWTELAP